MRTRYFDYAAATPLDPRVKKALLPLLDEGYYNPAAGYGPAKHIKEQIDEQKGSIAQILGVKSSEIIFTSGGTESNNLAIRGVMEGYPENAVLISSIEHESVNQPAGLFNVSEVAVNSEGIIDLADLEAKIDDRVVLISIMQANNEVGSIQPLRKVGQIIKQVQLDRRNRDIKTPLYFHTDACQGANYLSLSAHTLGVDMMSLNGGKIYGLKQSGILYISSKVKLRAQILGGAQQRNIRSGTESILNVVGFSEALKIAQQVRDTEHSRLAELLVYCNKEIHDKLPNAVINGPIKHRLPNNLSIGFSGMASDRMLIELEKYGILASSGSACKASSGEPSKVLKAMGLANEVADSTIRLSFGRQTTKKDIDYLLSTLTKITANT